MNEQHREVQAWLEQLYGGEPVPQYEISPRTIELLSEIRLKNLEKEKHVATITDDLQQKTEEYGVEADRLSAILQKLGLGEDSLSQSGNVSLRTLSSIAALLEVKDVSNSSLLLAMNELTMSQLQVADRRRAEQRLTASLFRKTKIALLKSNNLHKVLTGAEEQVKVEGPALAKKHEQSNFLKEKVKQYKKSIKKQELDFASVNANPKIYHDRLLKRTQELQVIKDKLHPVKTKLESYHSLPPDLSLAKVKVEEAKRELESLEEELSKHIDLMHM